MIVSPTEPFKVVFSLFSHEYLGYLVEGYVAQLNKRGEVSFKTQNISIKNIGDFAHGMEPDDKELIKLTDEIQAEVVLKKFNVKKIPSEEFFKKTFDPEKGDKVVHDAIIAYVENRKRQIFSKIQKKRLFLMGNDGIPTWTEIHIQTELAKAYFHFERQAEHTVYYPIIKCGDEKVKFQFKNAVIVNDLPAALFVDSKLYLFDQYADGKKIRPFLNKPNIIIPKKMEDAYYRKFIVPLIASFNVFGKGFDIILEKETCKPLLYIENSVQIQSEIFETNKVNVADSQFLVSLKFKYGEHMFNFDTFSSPAYVDLKKENENWIFTKIRKNLLFEKSTIFDFVKWGLDLKLGKITKPKSWMLQWLQANADKLKNIEIVQSLDGAKPYFLGYVNLELKIEEKNDWFDVNAVVQFGDFFVPFKVLRKYILNKIKEFELPNGQIATIPEAWFSTYSDLFYNIDFDEEVKAKLPLSQLGLVYQLDKDGLAATTLSRRLEKLRDFEKIDEVELPKKFKGVLRPYQKAGYDWLHFLNDYKLGGCLADDMGLGKTVTTLAFLQKLVENGIDRPFLLLMPTSLIYNWTREAKKFTPNLRIMVHFGPARVKDTAAFSMYDIVISSYGILRSDIDFVKNFAFEYAILDESQTIKNPSSSIFKSVIQLNTKNRLILSGTPLENSTLDLWSQMSFVNPGLFGSLKEFRVQYMNAIDKKRDEGMLQKLYSKIQPFMLRRQKSQVASDLPDKTETVMYCQMSAEQEKIYEETKSFLRNSILNSENGKKNNLLIIQGLTKLRQMANHPIMVDDSYEGESGKDNDVVFKLIEAVQHGHKTLVFSQFVKHLSLIKHRLDENDIKYLYLDGSTKNRMDLVEQFQNNEEPKVFLISLKAGGVGLNLTAADYVFLLDPWWNPAIEAQAIDRAHRIGQTKKVFSYKFISKDTIEEKILDLQNSKKQLFDELISSEEGFMKSLDSKDILALLD